MFPGALPPPTFESEGARGWRDEYDVPKALQPRRHLNPRARGVGVMKTTFPGRCPRRHSNPRERGVGVMKTMFPGRCHPADI